MGDLTDIVAIDGPAGAGKSTVARRVAEGLGFAYLDTGAMYRAATWWALHCGVDFDDPAAVVAATRALPLEMIERDGRLTVRVGGEDVTEAIRSPEVTSEIWRLDEHPDVRAHLVALQQELGARQPTVAEGRDIGTVVFPKAKCKVFLDASIEERTQRRAAELAAKGVCVDLARLRDDIAERDRKNRERKVSPLRRAADAVLVDTTAMTTDEVVHRIISLAKEVL